MARERSSSRGAVNGGAASEGPIRLNRYLSQCGLGSRRQCDKLIESGAVRINGQAVTQLGTKVDVTSDVVEYGKKTQQRVREHEYYAFHKPKDCIVTRSDPSGRTTVYDVLRKHGVDGTRLRYVGRLDRNSEGLLLLTSDGGLVHTLTHPRFGIKKVYRVRTNHVLSEEHARIMVEEGVVSEGVRLHAAEVRRADTEERGQKSGNWYEVVLVEGRNRQIRRMFEGLGYDVVRLKRTRFGAVRLEGLRRGGLRALTEREMGGLLHSGHKGQRKRSGDRPGRARK